MANIDDAFNVEILSVDDKALIGTGTAEPNVGAGFNGPAGSLYLKSDPGINGQLWVKFGPNDVDWNMVESSAPQDQLVKVSADDTTSGYLEDKIIAGTGIGVTILNPGANEQSQYDIVLDVSQLNDTVITGPQADNEILSYDTGTARWINQTATEAGLTLQSDFTSHTGDATIHFTESSIDHTNISSVGTNTHAQIDTHIADSTKHFLKGDILINDLGDVVISTPADNEILAYDTTSGDWINQTPAEAGLVEVGHTHEANEIGTPRLTGSSIVNVEQHISIFHSTGTNTRPNVTVGVSNSIDCSATTGFIRPTNDAAAVLYSFDVSNTNLGPLLVDTNYWVYIEYNAGTPQYILSTIELTDLQTNILVAKVLRDSFGTHINAYTSINVGDHAALMSRRSFEVAPYAHSQGAIISDSGTLHFDVTAGVFWHGFNKISTTSYASSVTNFTSYYSDGASDFTRTSVSTIDNTQYDNGTGTLATLTDGNYGVHWVYIGTDNDLYSVYGVGDYTLQEADEEARNSNLPNAILVDGILIGKLIVLKNATSFAKVYSAFLASFESAVASDHSNLLNIGTNSHIAIDTHIADTANPHSTSFANLTDTSFTSLVNGDLIQYNGTNWINGQPDRIAGVSGTDTTPGYLSTEIVAGAGIQLNILNPGADEKLEIQNLSSEPNIWLTVTGDTGTTTANTTTDSLAIVGGTGISTAVVGDTLTVSATDEFLKISANDTTSGYLNGKLLGGTKITAVENNDGANETLTLNLDPIAVPDLSDVTLLSTPAEGDGLIWNSTDMAWENVPVLNINLTPQTTYSVFGTIPAVSGTTFIPYSVGLPSITDGTQLFTRTISPSSALSQIKVTVSLAFSVSNASSAVSLTVWRDGVAIGAMADSAANSNKYQTVSFTVKDPGPFTIGVPITYTARFGKVTGNATWYVNTDADGNTFGGIIGNNAYTIEEVIEL